MPRTCTWRAVSGPSRAPTTTRCCSPPHWLCAVPRLGHVCVDLTTIRATVSTETEEQVDLDALPWPDAEEWLERLRSQSAGGRGPSAAARGDPALPGPLLVGRVPGGGRSARPGRAAGQDGVDTRRPAERPRRLVRRGRGPGSPAPRCGVRRPAGRVGHRREPGNRQDDDGRPCPGAPGRAGVRRRSAPAPGRPGRPNGEGGGPTRRGGQRRGGTPPDHAGATGAALRTPRPDAAPIAGLESESHPVPPPPAQSARPRRGHRRRDLHGVALAHGQPGRGRAPGRPPDTPRGSRAVGIGRGRCGARRSRRAGHPGPAACGDRRARHSPK